MSFVSVEHLQKSYSGTPVFSDINCSIAKGEFVTLLGPSGCGKSTLLRCIAGLTPVDGGKILLDGQDIVPLSPQKRGIGMVFQSYALFPNMTVEQNVAFGLRMQKVSANDSHKRVAEALQLVELNDFAKRYPHQLSGGPFYLVQRTGPGQFAPIQGPGGIGKIPAQNHQQRRMAYPLRLFHDIHPARLDAPVLLFYRARGADPEAPAV